MNRFLSLLLFFSFLASNVYAQPANDDCLNLIDLGEAPVCPPPGVYTNLDATESDIGMNNLPQCFNGVQNDVWFSFMVPNDGSVIDFLISVTGTMDGLVMPQIALYRGDCSELQELFCSSAALNETTVEMQALGLTPGVTYFLRINDYSASATPNWGEFELCVAEYIPSVNIGDEPGSSFCFGSLFDSGGPDNDYENAENFTYTICPDDFTQCIEVTIEDYALETGWDFLNIYAGNDVNATGILTLTGQGSDIVVYSPDGCVTLEFTSDGSGTDAGFVLSWSCSAVACDIPPFSNCGNPDAISALPFAANDLTTCTAGNDYNAGPCDNADYMEGNEYIFTYVSEGDECISVGVTGTTEGTGISIFSDCPDVAIDCISQTGSNNIADPVIGFAYLENPGTYYIAVANDLGCTPFNITVDSLECPNIFPSAALCEDALGLNGCTSNIPAVVSVAPGEGDPDFINDLNNGCILGGPLNYTFFFFQAATDGNFGFTMQAADPNEASDIDFNVWGPIPDFATACDFVLNNEPVRSSYAGGADPTGLADIHPVLGTPVTDEYDCDGDNDDFVTTLPVEAGEFYFVWINDWGNEIVSGAISIDFDQSTQGVLDATDFGQFTVSADTAVCVGSPVQLLATGGDLYEWTPSTGLSCTDCPNPIATPGTSTEYQVTIFGVCDNYSQFVTVDIFETGNLQDATVCLGEENEIYGGPQDINVSYSWTPATDLSCTDCPVPTLTANTVGSTEYILTIEAPGCTVLDTFVWTVVNSLAPEYSIADDAQLCIGENMNIGGPFNTDVTYSWTSDPAGFTNATSNPNITPTETTNYFLEVTNTACPFSSFDSVLVEVFIPPTLELANDTTLCLGNNMELGSTPNQQGVNYTWTPNTYLVDENDPNTEAIITDPGNYTYTLTAVRGACTVVETINIEVIEIALEITNPDTVMICQDESVTLNAPSLPAGVDVMWSPGTWLNTTMGNNVIATPLAEIMYTATVTAGICEYTDSVLILVDSLPEDLSIMPLDTMVCQGSIVQLTTTTYEQFEFPDIEFLWTPDSGFESPDSLLNMVIEANVDQTYTRTTTNGGCVSIDTARVTILPVEIIMITPPEPVICLGDVVNLDSDADTNMLEDIEWMPETGLSCTDCADPVATPTATTTYMISATQPNGCPAMGAVTIEVVTEPLIIFPDVDQCVGDDVTLNTAPDEPETTYSWTSPNDANYSSSEANPVVTMVNDITYIVTADNGVCPPVTDDIIFAVAQEPEFSASDDVTICSGDVITLEANGTEPGSYTWTPGPDNSSIEVSPATTTTYTTTYTWGPNCGTFTEDVTVTVEEGFNVSIGAEPPVGTINQGEMISFTALVDPPTADITNYSWTANGTPIGTNSATLADQPFDNPTTYTVVATSANGCTSEFSYMLNVIPPIWDIPSAFTPDGDGLNDEFRLLSRGEVNMESFQIFNRWGQKVFETNNPDTGWDGTHKGTMAPSDVYVYIIKLNLLSGEEILKGDVTLIR